MLSTLWRGRAAQTCPMQYSTVCRSCSGRSCSLQTSSHVTAAAQARHLCRTKHSVPSSSLSQAGQQAPTHVSAVSRLPGSVSSSTMGVAARSVSAAAKPPPATATAAFLSELSDEQQEAVSTPHQHVRVIAGPGSGKTRVVTARVLQLMQNGVAPSSILVITFTNKAAAELRTRLKNVLGEVPDDLAACTFHKLCSSLLRKYGARSDFTVVDEGEAVGIIQDIMFPDSSNRKAETSSNADSSSKTADSSSGEGDSSLDEEGSRNKTGSIEAAGSSTTTGSDKQAETGNKRKQKEIAKDSRRLISTMKNFVTTVYSGSEPKMGAEIIKELAKAGVPRFRPSNPPQPGHLQNLQRVAYVYDRYNKVLGPRRLDFDDLLHDCLQLVNVDMRLRGFLHARWGHVLVDEGQDTNLCQFELVRAITGPTSNLFMVGDPDQAIYGFRGSKSELLQQVFEGLYKDTHTTLYLSANYRSRPAIVTVADLIRRVKRPEHLRLQPGQPVRQHQGVAVELLQADNQFDEQQQIVTQLRHWRECGYTWDEMAVLCRERHSVRQAYKRAVREGIPSHFQTGDMWESIEVKAAVALLRCVTNPADAGDGLARRLIGGSSELKVPLTAGLGAAAIKKIKGALFQDSSSRRPAAASPADAHTTLGECLLAGCGLGTLTLQEAADIWLQWETAQASDTDVAVDTALQTFAVKWQPPAGLKKLTKTQAAALARIRGLVQLATAAAMLQLPEKVLQLLLTQSGIMGALQQAAEELPAKDADRAKERLDNLDFLLNIATEIKSLDMSLFNDEASEAGGEAVLNSMGSGSNGGSNITFGSSKLLASHGQPCQQAQAVADLVLVNNNTAGGSSSSQDGNDQLDNIPTVKLLLKLMDYCSLQGDTVVGAQSKQPRVQFMTMHASKGTEFRCVVNMSMCQGIIPSSRCETPAEWEQERNLAYVAATRAKDHLLLTWPAARMGSSRPTEVSCFLQPVLEAAREGLPGVQFIQSLDVMRSICQVRR